MRARKDHTLRWQFARKGSVEFPTWMVVSLVLSAIFILLLFGVAEDLYASVIKRPDESLTSFNTLTTEIQQLLADKNDFAAVKEGISYTLEDDYVVVGFDSDFDGTFYGTGDNQEYVYSCGVEGAIHSLERPTNCMPGQACLCFYESEWDNLGVQKHTVTPRITMELKNEPIACTSLQGDITFAMEVKDPTSSTERYRRDYATLYGKYTTQFESLKAPPSFPEYFVRDYGVISMPYGYLILAGKCGITYHTVPYYQLYIEKLSTEETGTILYLAEKSDYTDVRYEELRAGFPPSCSDYSVEQCKQRKPGTEVSVEATMIIDSRACSSQKASCVYQPSDACTLTCLWPSCQANEKISAPCMCNEHLIDNGYCCLNQETSLQEVEARPCHCKNVYRCADYTDSEGLDCTHDTCYVAPLTGCIWDVSASRCQEKTSS